MTMVTQRLALLGCGHMGKAILTGLLKPRDIPSPFAKYTVSVPSAASVQRLTAEFATYKDQINFLCAENVQAAHEADAILLSFPPNQVQAVMGEAGMADAVNQKLVISILAGISRKQIEHSLASEGPESTPEKRPHVVRMMPSMGVQADVSATLMVNEDPPLPPQLQKLAETTFEHIGRIHKTSGDLFGPLTALNSVSHGLIAAGIEALIDGCVAEGIPRDQAQAVSGQSMLGYSTLLAQGRDPTELKNSLLIPGGFTTRAIQKLEKELVPSAIKEATVESIASTKEN